MWEVEPTLYWRVKKNGKWTWVRAIYDLHEDRFDITGPDGELVTLWWPTPEGE